jgi:2-aminomuconate deaminase
MTATEVAQMLGTNVATVHRFLVTLEEIGAVSRTATGKFQLGLVLTNLGGKVESQKLLIEQVQSHLNELAAEFREVAHCALRNGPVAVNIARALPDRSLTPSAGDPIPLHCTAVGKVLLAGLPPGTREGVVQHLELERFTSHTQTDRQALLSQLREVARQGVATDDEEWEDGLRSVAVPVSDGHGKIVAALALSAPASRLDDTRLGRVCAALRARAERLEHALFTESRVFPQKARPKGPFPHLKRVDDFIFISGTSARRPDDSFEGVRVHPDGTISFDIRRQTRVVFENIRDMLTSVGAGLDSLIDVHAYLIDMRDYDTFNEAYAEFFGFEGPTRTTVAVSGLPHPHQRLMVRGVAYAPRRDFGKELP